MAQNKIYSSMEVAFEIIVPLRFCKKNKVDRLIQCCYDISNKMTREREISALLKAINLYNLKERFYTYNYKVKRY